MNRYEIVEEIFKLAENGQIERMKFGWCVMGGDVACSQVEMLRLVDFIVDNLDECKK